jgi:hypothetical protein
MGSRAAKARTVKRNERMKFMHPFCGSRLNPAGVGVWNS